MGTVINFVAMADMPNRLYELRRARGLSQQKLADLAGCSKMHVSGVERGTREFSLSLMRRIAEVFGVSPAELLSRQDNPGLLAVEEQLLVDTYRSADKGDQAKILKVAEALAPRHANDDQRHSA
jgi:transcriptional regulator with XRE-family HTH domain